MSVSLKISLLVTFLLVFLASGDESSFDCTMRQLAMDFAHKIQPFRTTEHFQQLADALNGAKEAQNCHVKPNPQLTSNNERYPSFSIPTAGSTFYVDAEKGSDSNSGTLSSPFKTIERGLKATRGAGTSSTLVLRKGTFYLENTIKLTTEDNGLTIQNYPNEEVWISGGVKLESPTWKAYKTDKENIYVTDLSSYSFDEVTGFRVNGKRAIRARYPNADPEIDGFGSTLTTKQWMAPTLPTQPDKEVNPSTPVRADGESFQHYQLGIEGPCKHFTPPAGYWCGNMTEGGGHFTYRVPSGMVADRSILPHQPYEDPVGAVVQAWRPAHWASWMFEVGKYEESSSSFYFSKGGFQGARGNNKGAEFYIENVWEELDSPAEFFFNKSTNQLYLYYNDTGAPKDSDEFVVPKLKVLFSVSSSAKNPIKSLSFKGVNFRDTALTYLDPHGMPSGGDWGLQRTAALNFEGTESSTIDSCIFSRLDGNGVLISAYNRHFTITKSEFVWIGDTAIASWGNAVGSGIDGMGWDATNGDQPRFNVIEQNFVHELGIWEKQSSFYFQAKTCQSTIHQNIFFNGPRAGINFNDGMGGGNNLTSNLILNTCRESGDHGPFNSWDRQVYITKVRTGQPSTTKEWDQLYGNFLIANYNSQEAIDNDDGSAYYKSYSNFLVYSGNGMKNDFGGHDNRHYNNIYSYVGKGYTVNSNQLAGHNDYFYNNTVIMTKDGNYGSSACSGPAKPVVHDNKIFTPTGKVTECGMSLKDWQAKGNDPGTTASTLPSDRDLESWVRQLLGL